MKLRIKPLIFLLAGSILMIGLALFAGASAPGQDLHWGIGRVAALALGLLLALAAVLYTLYANATPEAQRGIQSSIQSLPMVSRLRTNQDLAWLARLYRDTLFTLPVVFLVLLAYTWLFGGSPWNPWPARKTTSYYAWQAQGFRDGHLYLPIEPAPELLRLSNPYDPQERQGIPAPVDISLYQGRFYLYWGPVPALVISALRWVYHGDLDDLALTFGFVCGIFLSQYLLIVIVRERFFRTLPRWTVLLAILLAGLAIPSTWMISTGKIYEAAIAGGQFFFLCGLLAVFSALDRASPSGWRLALAGTLWVLAIGTRNILVFPIAFIVLVCAYWLYRTGSRSPAKLLRQLLPLGLPLAIGALCLGWYNWARFGSLTEIGLSYQLAGLYLQKYSNELFSPFYLFQNLYNYLLVPFQARAEFPFIEPTRGNLTAVVPFLPLPGLYFTNLITGLLCAVPFAIFSLVPPARFMAGFFKRGLVDQPEPGLFNWIVICLAGASLTGFAALQMLFWAAMRYMEDFMPALLVLSVIGFWQGYQWFASGSLARKLYAFFGIFLALTSATIGILLAISGHLIFLK